MTDLAMQQLLRAELLKYTGGLNPAERQILNTYLGVSENTPTGDISSATSTALQSQPVEVKTSPPEKEIIEMPTQAYKDDQVLSGVEKLFLQLYREYVKKDEGKQLASELGKFARFTQSEVAKSSNVEAH